MLRKLNNLPHPYDIVTADEVDDALNHVQDVYIQPVALIEGRVDYTTRGEQTIIDEDNPLDTTDTVYTATWSPFKYGTNVIVKVDDVIVETDAVGFEHTVDYEAGTVTFAAPQTGNVEVSYTAEEIVDVADFATDIYEFDMIRDLTHGLPGREVRLLRSHNLRDRSGVLLYDDQLYFREIERNRIFRFFYFRKLSRLGPGAGEVTTPEIDPRWHDLYWLGALTQFDERTVPIFMAKLNDFTVEREDKTRQRPIKMDLNW